MIKLLNFDPINVQAEMKWQPRCESHCLHSYGRNLLSEKLKGLPGNEYYLLATFITDVTSKFLQVKRITNLRHRKKLNLYSIFLKRFF